MIVHDQQFDDNIDLGELLLTLLGEWRTVAVITIASTTLAASYALLPAPTQYTAEARLTGFPWAFCPYGEACSMSLREALSLSAAQLDTPAAFDALDAMVNISGDEDLAAGGEFAAEEARRAFLRAVDVSADDTAASVSVKHSSGRRAVELANAVAGLIVSELEMRARENYAELQRGIEAQLATLPAPTRMASVADATIAIERAALTAEVDALADRVRAALPVALVDVPAAQPLELQSPRRALGLALGVVLGAFMGMGAAVVTARRRGRLYGRGAIAGAFGQEAEGVVVAGAGVPDDLRRMAFWQDVRVSLGAFEGGAITLTGVGPDATMMRAAGHFAAEFSRSGLRVAIIDLGARMAGRAAVDTQLGPGEDVSPHHDANGAASVFSCSVQQLQERLCDLLDSCDVVIILPPQIACDLPAVREAMARSQARVILVPAGVITRHDVRRLMSAARGAQGPQVVAMTDRHGRDL